MTIKQKILSTISDLIDKQNAKGLKKYEQSIDDCPTEDYNWKNMIIEELIDALQYQQKEIHKLKDAVEGARVISNVATQEKLNLEKENKFNYESIQKAVEHFKEDEHIEGMARLLLALEVSK